MNIKTEKNKTDGLQTIRTLSSHEQKIQVGLNMMRTNATPVKRKSLAISMIAKLSKIVGGLDDTCLNFVNPLHIGYNSPNWHLQKVIYRYLPLRYERNG